MDQSQGHSVVAAGESDLKVCTLSRVQEVTIRGGGLKHVACAEDEDFIQALDKMMLENLQVRHAARPSGYKPITF